MREALPGAIEVMKPSSTPAAASAALRFAMSVVIASWPVYASGPTHTGHSAARGPVDTPESGSAYAAANFKRSRRSAKLVSTTSPERERFAGTS